MALPFGFTPLEARTYLILTICWVSIVVVNMLEQPYARSLVQCDVPVNTTEGAEFSGSQYCGHRLYVIGVGAEISGWGQSLENVGRIAITLFVSGFADYGRKRAALLGQFLITLSTVLFALAQFLPVGLGVPTYIIAQGLQGMSGIGILDQIITGDVALQLEDTVAVYGRKGLFTTIMYVFMIPIIVYVQYAEITDFTYVWAGIVALNTVAFLLLYLFFPETLHKKEDKKDFENFSVIRVATDELKHFRSLFTQHPYIGPKIVEDLFGKMADCASIGLPFLMATFHFSQFDAFVFSFLPMLVGGILLGGVVPGMCHQHGHAVIWNRCFWYYRLTAIGGAFLQPFRFLGLIPMPLVSAALHLPLAGWPAVAQGVEIRLIQQENNAKFQAMSQLTGFFCGSITSALYTHLFQAEATTYVGKILPYAISALFLSGTLPMYVFYNGPQQLAECKKIDEENKEKWEAHQKEQAEAAEKEEKEKADPSQAEKAENEGEAAEPTKTEETNLEESEKQPEDNAEEDNVEEEKAEKEEKEEKEEQEPEIKTEEQKKVD